MKSKALISVLIFISVCQYSSAQQKGVDDLVLQFQKLLHPPPDQEKNSLAYTQHYIDLKKKVAALGPENKAAFESGIAKYSSDAGYAELHETLLSDVASEQTTDSLQNKSGSSTSNGAPANVASVDSTVQIQVFDKKHKLLGATAIKPADIEGKMKKDGYQVSSTSYDFNTHAVTLILTKSDGSGTTAKITLPASNEVDAKYKLANGQSLSVHRGADGTSTVKVAAGKQTSSKKK